MAPPRRTLQESGPTSLTESAAWIGHKLAGDRYEIKDLLGEGGMGTVFLARDQKMNRDVVIKVPRRSLVLDNPDFRARFQREILSMTRLSHPHIVQVYDAGEHEGLPFAVLQYLPDGTLEQQRPRDHAGQICPLPIEHLAGWLPHIADALDYVHSQGYVHRDVKPSNILFKLGQAYLSDFGLAKVTAGDAGQWRTVTQAGVLGTPPYMAPEVHKGQKFGPPADQYSLAVMVYELLAGRLPFDVPTAQAVLLKQETEPVPDLRAVCPTVPQGVADAVARGMAKQAADRFPDGVSFARAVLRPSGSARRISTAAATSPASTSSAGVAPTRLEPSPAVRAHVPPTQALHPAAGPASGSQLQVAERTTRSQPRGRKSAIRTVVFQTLIVGLISILIVVGNRIPEREVATHSEPQPFEPDTAASAEEADYVPKPVTGLPTITNSIGMTLALIPAGEFLMGSPDSDSEAFDAAKPQHPVRITKPFYLGVFEVTQAEYQKVTGSNPSYFQNGSGYRPVEQVTWEEATTFCRLLSEMPAERAAGRTYRLPTEAEWEYACRAGSKTTYPFGDSAAELANYAWFGDNSEERTHPVGQKQPNSWGLYDMQGNVWEWCGDWFDGEYYTALPVEDPAGPTGGSLRVFRGGGWIGDASDCRAANRDGLEPSFRLSSLGFRLAMTVSSASR